MEPQDPISAETPPAETEPPTTNGAEELRDEVRQFSKSVSSLAVDVVENVNGLRRFSRRTRKISLWLAASLVLDVLLTGYLWWDHRRGDAAQHQLQVVQRQLQVVQQTISTEVFCPLYGLIVSGYHPELRPAGPQRDEYERDFKVILNGYVALGCVPVNGAAPVSPGSPAPRTSPMPTGSASPAH